MTLKKIKALFELYDISEDVELRSDSGWECGWTDIDGIYYNKSENAVVFTQLISSYDTYFKDGDWQCIYGEIDAIKQDIKYALRDLDYFVTHHQYDEDDFKNIKSYLESYIKVDGDEK